MEDVNTAVTTPTARRVVRVRPDAGVFDLDLAAVWRYRELLVFLVWREIKVRYKQAALGAAWAIVQPIFAVTIFTIVFSLFAKIPSDGQPYAVFAYSAYLPWFYFQESFRRSSVGLVGDAELVRKVYFPRLIIPLAMISAPLIDFALGFLVFLPLMFWFGATPTWHIVFVPCWLMIAGGLALGCGLWLGPINVRYRDVMHTLPFALQLWMYATPVVYPLSMVPEDWRGLYSLNPMVGVVEGFRWSLLGTGQPDMRAVGISLVVVAVILTSGLLFFRRMEKSFADVI